MTKGGQHAIAIVVCITFFIIWMVFKMYIRRGILIDLLFCAAIVWLGKFIWTFPLDEELEADSTKEQEKKPEEEKTVEEGKESDPE